METKGMFKRIAAVTLAALTVVTSSGIDYNMLSAKAAEPAAQVTNVSTESTLQTKNAKVNASSKISFSTDEDLKQAVEDGSYTVDVETNKVKVASIKYNKTLLEMGTDFTATAKRTSATTKKIDGVYKYTYTITITGKGRFTGTAKKTGVTMKSQIKPKVTTKKKVKKASATLEYQAVSEDGSNPIFFVASNDSSSKGWSFEFTGGAVLYTPADATTTHQIAYYGNGQKAVSSGIIVKYKNSSTESVILAENSDYTITPGSNTEIGEKTGSYTIEFTTDFWNAHSDIDESKFDGGITVRFRIIKSIFGYSDSLKLKYESKDHNVVKSSTGNKSAEASGDFEYAPGGVKPQVYYKYGEEYTELKGASLVNYSNETKIGKAKITAKIPHTNVDNPETIYISYNIVKRSLSGLTISGIKAQTYTGKEIEPDFTVTDNSGNTLIKSTDDGKTGDYTVSYSNNIDANIDADGNAVSEKSTPTVKVTATADGNYTGDNTKEFNISPKSVTDSDTEIKITGIDTVPYTGKTVEPKPTITYSPSGVKDSDGNQLVNTLKEGTDYTITYAGNEGSLNSIGTATIKFKRNYSGTRTKKFTVEKGKINAKGTIVSINGTALPAISTDNTTEIDATSYPINYSPDKTELPVIQIKNSAGAELKEGESSSTSTDIDYIVEGPNEQTNWPKIGEYTFTVKGKNNYENSELKIKIKVDPLSLKSDCLTVIDQGFGSDGKSTAQLSYSHTVNGKTYTGTVKMENNFTITPEKNTNISANANVLFTLTAVDGGNYKDSTTTTFGFGKNLSKAVETKDKNTTSDIRIRAFDPFTGIELTDTGLGMQYYGTNIHPYYSVEIKKTITGSSGASSPQWVAVPSDQFTISDVTTDTNTDDSSRFLYKGKVTITANDKNTSVYGSKELTFNVAYHSMSADDSGKWTYKITDDIKPDATNVSSKIDINNIKDNLKLTLKPANAGKFVAVISTNSGTETKTVDNPNSTEAQKYINGTDKNVLAFWTAPTISSGELKLGTDYTVEFPKDNNGQPLNDGTVKVNGIGNYSQYAIITLGQENIGNDDFYITYNGKNYTKNPAALPDIDYDGKEHLPSVSLIKSAISSQQSFTTLTEGTDYWVSYINPDNERTDKYGYLINEEGKYVDANNQVITDSAVSANASGQLYDSDKKEITGKKAVKCKNDFKQAGDYKIILTGTGKTITTTDSSGKTTTTTTGTYYGTRTVTYTIKASDADLTATFTVSSTPYNKTSTLKPEFEYDSGKAPDGAFSLKVRAKGVSGYLTEGTDYTVAQSDGSDLTEPGTKTYTITGINRYNGKSTTASYDVTVDMTELQKTDKTKAKLFSTPTLPGSGTYKLFYDGGSVLTTLDDTQFNPDNVLIKTVTNKTTLNKDEDYTIDIDNGYGDKVSQLYSGGAHSVTFKGLGAYTGSFTLSINVIITRKNLLWRGDSTTEGAGTTELILPWRESGYKLGTGAMSLYKTVNGVSQPVTLDQSGSTDADVITVDDKNLSLVDSKVWSDVDGQKHKIVIKGPQGSDDSTTLYFTIEYDLSNATIDLKNSSVVYSGNDPYDVDNDGKPDAYPAANELITVRSGNKKLTFETDYGIERNYSDSEGVGTPAYSRAGTIEITLTEVENHSKYFNESQKPTASYTITKLQENDKYKITGTIAEFTYNGESQTPSESAFKGKVLYGDTTLKYGTDYTVSFDTDSVNAGSKTIIISGTGNYGGSKTIANAYKIDQKDLSTGQIKDIEIPDQYYTASAITPRTLTVKGVTGDLIYGKDFSITNAENNTNTGTATVTVNGIGTNFTGSADNVTFEIVKLTLTADNFEVTNATYNKGGSVGVDQHIRLFIPDGKGGDGKIYLKRGTDYTLVFTKGTSTTAVDPTDAGTYDVQVSPTATSDYVTGSPVTLKFIVDPLNIEDVANEFEVANAAWTGTAVTPKVTLNGKDLDSTYTVTYENNTDACAKTRAEMLQYDPNFDENKIPTAIITGSGNYVGIIRKTFQIGQPFSDATVTPTDNSRLTYNGSSQKKEYTVTYTDGTGTRQTLATSRYTVKYPDNTTDAGDKTVLFTANGGPLYGTKTVTYTIYPVSGSVWSVEFTNLTMDSTGQYTVQYQGAAITPEVKAYVLGAGGSRTEIPLKSSEIKYANNTAAGTASVSISPNNYEGTKTLYFRILGVDISGDDVYAAFTDGITRRQYTGTALTPAVTVTFAGSLGTVTLRKDVDFSLTYENNTKAGAADVKITGIGNYSGTKTLDFDIFANLNDKTSVFTIPKQMYTGEAITELTGATLKAGGNDLKLGTDYTLSITSTDSFRTKGTAIFTAQGKYYEGTRTVQFEIGNDASMYNILGVASTYVYDRQAHKPVPVVTDKQGTVYSVDSVTYASTSDGDTCINAGNVKMQIVITSHGQSVTIPYNYTIEPKNINTASITPIADVDYNGKAHTPTIRITDGTNLLTGSPTSWDGTADFVYTYYNNVQPGTATVSIQGINNYTGVANVYFAINVKAAPQMIVTAMPSGRLKVTWKKVSGVSGYRIFYSSANGTQKQTTLSSSKKSTYITGLTRGVVYTVGLQSFITANGQNGYSTASVQQIATSTSKPKITSAKSTGKGKIKITWKKVSNATAYMVYRKTAGSSKWVRVKTTKSTSFTNTGLKSGKKYTYKVISYKQSGVKRSFSKYSTGKTVKAK